MHHLTCWTLFISRINRAWLYRGLNDWHRQLNSDLAQLAECGTDDLEVVGLIPGRDNFFILLFPSILAGFGRKFRIMQKLEYWSCRWVSHIILRFSTVCKTFISLKCCSNVPLNIFNPFPESGLNSTILSVLRSTLGMRAGNKASKMEMGRRMTGRTRYPSHQAPI